MKKNVIIKGSDFSDFGLGNVYNLLNNQGNLEEYYTVSGVASYYPFAFPNSRLIGKTIIGLTVKVKVAGYLTIGKVSGFLDTNVLSEGEKIVTSLVGVQTFFLENPITIGANENIYLGLKRDTLIFGYSNNSHPADPDAPDLLAGLYTSTTSSSYFNGFSANNSLGVNLICQDS